MTKRIVSLILVLCLCMPLVPVVPVSADGSTIPTVELGVYNSVALKSDGSLWVYGEVLNDKSGEAVHTPTKMLDDIASVSLGLAHSAVIKKDGSLWTWGINMGGVLGDGTKTSRYTPVKIMDGVMSVSLGTSHSAAIKNDGSLWMWGANYNGQLGDGTTDKQYTPIKIMDDVKNISLGVSTSAAIKNDGSLWIWGYAINGNIAYPKKIMDDVVAVSLGDYHCAAIKKDGSLYIWGSIYGADIDSYSEIYIKEEIETPVKIMDNVASVSLGQYHSAAIKNDGSLWMWGCNFYGELGDGTTKSKDNPTKIMDDVASVSLGYCNSAAIKKDGSLWMWGANQYGQLGNGTTHNVDIPVKIMELGQISKVNEISVYLNNEKLEFDQPPVIDNDRTLVPLRGIFEAMGFEIDWDETTQSITATNGIHEIVLKIDDTTAYVDGIAHTLDVPAKVINGRTLVPARFVAESVGADVKWDEISNSVNITYEPGSVNISINTSLTDEWYYRREDSMYVQGGYFGKVELVTKDGTPIKNPENYSIQLENTNGFSLDQYGTFSVTANYGATTKINVKNLKGDVISNVVVEVCESPQSFKFVVENIHTINKLQDTSNNYYTYDVVYNDMFTSQDGKQFEDAAMIAYEFWTDPVGYFGKDAKNAYIGLLTEALTNDVALTNMSESIQKEQDKILAEYLVELLGELSNLTGDTSEKVKDSCERIVGDLGFDIMKTTQQMIHDSISSLSYQQKKNLIQKHSADLQIINEELIKEGKQLKFWSNTETACKAMGIAVEGANVIYKGYQQSADIIALQNVREQYRDGLEMLKTPTTNSTIVAAIDEVIAIMDDEFLACAKSIISESGGIRFAAETFVTLFGKSFATKLLSKLGVDVTSAAAANVISKIGAGVNIASTVIATGEITGLVCDIGLGTGTYIAATNELMMLMPLIRDLRAAVSMELRSASDKLNTKDKCIAGFELEKTLCVYASNLVREMCNTKVNSRFVQFVRAVVSKDITLGNSYDSSYDDIYYSEATRIRDLVLIR